MSYIYNLLNNATNEKSEEKRCVEETAYSQ